MNIYTQQDLSTMQQWPLERKIQVTQAKIMEWYCCYGGNVAVSLSGGKDSTVLLDLARRISPDIRAAFVDTGLEYPEIRAFVKSIPNVTWLRPEMPFPEVIKQYGYPVISKEVAKRIYYARKGSIWAVMHLNGRNKDGTPSKFNERYMKWRGLMDAPFLISEYCCMVMKKRPLHRFTKATGAMPIIGTMACESARRRSAYLQTGCNAFTKKEPSSQPMSFWMEQDVLRYLQLTGIPYAPIYGEIIERGGKLITTGAKRTGCMFCMFGVHLEKEPNRFQRMELTHPKQHDYCIYTLGCGPVLDFLDVPYLYRMHSGLEVSSDEEKPTLAVLR
jgi:3'-phosphoadenosine 5'-phosphosulfate sulfotransferase (PAPS reductase)/FAD synthetase